MRNALLFGDAERLPALREALMERGLTVRLFDVEQAAEQGAWAELVVCLLPGASKTAERSLTEVADWEEADGVYDRTACAFLRAVHALLPTLQKEARIALWTHADSSINNCAGTGDLARRMSLAAVNMAAVLLFHELRPKGYSMRICASRDARYAADCFLRARSYEADNLPHSDEERLSLRGELGAELPW